ncbi:glycosyltransferase family protein [Cellulomonas edaphi]|uniref:Glycosyltransferase family 1 protein n=1 Tax=Cellulomonas edaphi TaxID=3053468 RepID=A0ABT7S5V1_9CELL|nr:glycosyltransferase family 1 protein [Cellulomons edaphi]MDM7830997.1 glycosyltransferase family 1 protein [Cellulomons edaphi]
MRIAVRYGDVLVDPDGHVAGHDAGATLVRRLLRVFPQSILVGEGPRRCDGFDMLPVEFLDATDTVVVNMNVVDSVSVWRTLARTCPEPRLMNFVWWNTSQFEHDVDRAALALSCALFPTFANSERTAREVREIVGRWTVPAIAEKARIAWVNLGIRLDHRHPREETDVPVVLYPAISLSARKRPDLFVEVVEAVARRTPLRVEARLVDSHLVSERAMRLSTRDWAWVGPLTATREDYWAALARTTAFLATATEESYGLEYIEALVAGAVGVFPDRPWVHAILPEHYPLVYRSTAEATAMLLRAVSEPAACRWAMDACAGGSFARWLRERHSDDRFDEELRARVHHWFG